MYTIDERNKKLGRILSINQAYYYGITFKRKAEELKKEPSEDTRIRHELQELIRKRLKQGCTKEQILLVLQSESQFAKLSKFFESYIDNYLKNRIDKNKLSDQSEER